MQRLRRQAEAHPEAIALGGGRSVELLGLLGKGTGSTVFRGIHVAPSGVARPVALKLFSVSSDETEDFVRVLTHTIARAAHVDHPNIVRVEDCGVFRAQPFILAELVDGIPLSVLVEAFSARGQRLPLDLALFIAVEVSEGLSAARLARDPSGAPLELLHLGLTAREVLLSWMGEVKVSDFEVSNIRPATSSVRSLKAIARRANMMAPEVAHGMEGDARSDVFALGVLMRELLVGPRFPKELTSAETLRLAREGYVHTACFQPHLPEPLVEIMGRALAIEPTHRYQHATALAFDLRRVVLGLGVGDARYFLRRTLRRECGDDEEITCEQKPAFLDAADVQEDE